MEEVTSLGATVWKPADIQGLPASSGTGLGGHRADAAECAHLRCSCPCLSFKTVANGQINGSEGASGSSPALQEWSVM